MCAQHVCGLFCIEVIVAKILRKCKKKPTPLLEENRLEICFFLWWGVWLVCYDDVVARISVKGENVSAGSSEEEKIDASMEI